MSKKVIEFPRLWSPPPSPADAGIKALDDLRGDMRRQWRRDRRRPGRKSKRLVITVGPAPTADPYATALWGMGAALLAVAERALDSSVSIHANADRVLRRYAKLVRRIARDTEKAARAASREGAE